MNEYGLFSDDSEDYTAEQAVEAGFYSFDEAAKALAERYSPEDGLHVHLVEEEDEADEDGDDGEQRAGDVCPACGEPGIVTVDPAVTGPLGPGYCCKSCGWST